MIKKYERAIYKVCTFYVSDYFSIDDLYQESVCNLWKGFPRFRHESSIYTWIYRITLNTCISCIRKNKRTPQKSSLTLSINIPAEPLGNHDEIRELYSLINKLKPIDRAVILLWLEEKSYQEIAEITGLTPGNIGVRLNRIRKKLREMFKN